MIASTTVELLSNVTQPDSFVALQINQKFPLVWNSVFMLSSLCAIFSVTF